MAQFGLTVLCAAPAGGQEVPREDPRVPIARFVREVADRAGINIFVHEDVKGEVEPPDPGKPWRDRLADAASHVAAEVFPLGEETLVLVPSSRITIPFDGAEVQGILERLMEHTKSLAAPVLKGRRLTLQAGDELVSRFLDRLSKEAGILVIREPTGVVRISTEDREKNAAQSPIPPEVLAALGLGESSAAGMGRLPIDVEEKTVSEVLAEIGKATGLDLSADEPFASRKLSLRMREAPWKDVLRAIEWIAGGTLWDDGKGKVRIRKVPRLSMEFSEKDAGYVLEQVAMSARVRLEVAESVTGTIGILDVWNLPWRDVLVILVRCTSISLRLEKDGTIVAE